MDKINYYNVKEVSQILNVSEETVRRWARSGKLSGIQKSRKDGFIFSESEITAFLLLSPKYALRNTGFDHTISCEGARTCIQKTKAIINEIKHIDELMKYLDSRKKQLIQQYYAIKPE